MENKTVQVYSEKLGKMIDVDIINKDCDSRRVASVMLVVDEEEE